MLRLGSRLISRVGSAFSSSTTQKTAEEMSVDDIFPAPKGLPVHPMSPVVWPGADSESTEALREVLKDNHKRWNIFSNPEEGFHNHITHHALALWYLGAPKEILQSAYKVDSEDQTPLFDSPEPITEDNFNDHLGDKKFWKSYLDFFTNVVKEIGPSAALEEYVFSTKRNWGTTDKSGTQNPEMLNRFVSGLVHPLIHTGYGFEFNLPGMVIEGLAETALHKGTASPLNPVALWHDTVTHKVSSRIHQVSTELDGTTTAHPGGKGLDAFTIVSNMLQDDSIKLKEKPDRPAYAGGQFYRGTMVEMGDKIYDYAKQWDIDPTNIEKKIEELQWMNTVFYGVAGFKGEGKDFSANFYLMHLVTSSLFLPSLISALSPSSQILLLRSYFSISLVWWVSRGRPKLDIQSFFSAESTKHPIPPDQDKYPPPQNWHLPSPSSPLSTTPNSWLSIIQRSLIHPDDHLPKLQRALAHYGKLYGGIEKGYWKDSKLPGAEFLDGSLFIRAAGLTADRMGRVSDKAPFWDRNNWFAPDL